MKLISLILIFVGFLTAEEIRVTTEGGSKNVYFSLKNREVARVDSDTWQLAFKSGNIAGTIRANKNTKVYVAVNMGIEDFKTPILVPELSNSELFRELYNDNTDWTMGAFNTGGAPESDFNYGWGEYVQGDGIYGNKLFVLEITKSGRREYRQFIINSVYNNSYYIELCNLDGSNPIENIINKSTFSTKNFAMFDVFENQIINEEPNRQEWDLLFTDYVTPIQAGPQIMYYNVAGVLQNQMTWVSKVAGIHSAEPTSDSYSPIINTIGYDWKTFSNGYIMEDYAYFVQRFSYNQDLSPVPSGEVYRIVFTNYEGGADKASTFEINTITASVDKDGNSRFAIYPNIISNGEEFNIIWNDNQRTIANQVQIIDSVGEVVYSENVNSVNSLTNLRINSNLSTGLYFVVFSIGNEVFTQKLMVK
jgi:hypothetical protein